MRCTIIAVGRLRPPYADDVSHYRQLLSRYVQLQLVEVREDDRVERRIPERSFVVLLDAEGRTFDSVGFARWMDERKVEARPVCFVIGGAKGLALDACDMKLSLGPMTLPHQLARVVLLEQLYRGSKILAGEPYHY
jgi:23S rRNA (pseudouridine1915-N3)-methyltransferase